MNAREHDDTTFAWADADEEPVDDGRRDRRAGVVLGVALLVLVLLLVVLVSVLSGLFGDMSNDVFVF